MTKEGNQAMSRAVPPARRDRQEHRLHLAVALDGAGWHPAAWREPDARPRELFSARYWTDLAQEGERGLLDFITIEDALGLQSASRFAGPDDRTDQVRGRLDAVLIASRIAPRTSRIGLIPTATTTHTEPFHVSTALATLDYVSTGRAGFRAQLSPQPEQARHFGRRELPPLSAATSTDPRAAGQLRERFGEAADFVEVVRRLWDSWEDDAVIRDVSTGRFIDRDKLHYIDFEGQWFAVRGPSITPRPPQGQLPVVALAHAAIPYELAARVADIVLITPGSADHAGQIVAQVRLAEREVRRMEPLSIYADLTVFLDAGEDTARERKARLDRADGADYRSDTAIFTGTPSQLADLLLEWRLAGIDGFRLRPGALPHDLQQVTRHLIPILQGRGTFRTAYAGDSQDSGETLRERLGLGSRPANRYARESAP
jgi:alkanesulfonate monooxygenase SsuD/methylene tetrahydromethanopterin reductase-like flavin-dependent oxidoreductase (luciferase family)